MFLGLRATPVSSACSAAPCSKRRVWPNATEAPARVFWDFRYATRVIGKAEYLADKAIPRFVVTSLGAEEWPARQLYEQLYCARGEMENRIKEAQLELFADRTSSHTFKANQLRLWLSSFAYVLIEALRRLGLRNAALALATAGSIRLKLIKIGALISVSVRRVKIAMSSSHPHQAEFIAASMQWAPRCAGSTAPTNQQTRSRNR